MGDQLQTGLANAGQVLNLPAVPRMEYSRNFISTAVCELRFPTLLEFEAAPPIGIQKALRKRFPDYRPSRDVSLGPDSVDQKFSHRFLSKKGDWLVSFKSSAIALETETYTNFEDFAGKLDWVVEKVAPLLDSDYFTRVGLRYINHIPIGDGPLDGWVRQDLVAGATDERLGQIDKLETEIRGLTESGRYTFRHGLATDEQANRLYRLDFDFSAVTVERADVSSLVRDFNELAFWFFEWAAGEKAKAELGEAHPKGS